MFNAENDEKKLDWMYKGPTSTVDREEYLLGRTVDKTLEQLNDEEKQKHQGFILPPKNRVEHECIPPSIRDFNKIVQAEQVDLSAKLQEDPLVTIKKREEETRRQFLQNPVQLKKLQKALKAQQVKDKKRKKKKHSDTESDPELSNKLKLLKGGLTQKKKRDKEDSNLDTILIHKFAELKSKLTQKDLQDIMDGKITDSDDSENDDNREEKRHFSDSDDASRTKKPKKSHRYTSSDDSERAKSKKNKTNRKDDKNKNIRDRSSPSVNTNLHKKPTKSRTYDSDDSDSSKPNRNNWGLVSSDGSKIPLKKHVPHTINKSAQQDKKEVKEVARNKPKKLSDKEKEKLRLEMMKNAAWRDKERAHNVKKYRENEEKDSKQQKDLDPDFVHRHLLKSANSSSVESRIKANLNKIQRSSRDMNRNFSKR